MGLKAIHLTLAERYLVADWLGAMTKGDIDTARTMREIRRRLEVRSAQKAIETATDLLSGYGAALPWDNLYYGPDDLLQRFQELHEIEEDDKERERLDGLGTAVRLACSNDTELYTIDSSYLDFLRTDAVDKDWASVQQRVNTPAGPKVETVQVPVPPGKMELFADLVDKINAALAEPDYRAKAEP